MEKYIIVMREIDRSTPPDGQKEVETVTTEAPSINLEGKHVMEVGVPLLCQSLS